MHAVVVPGLAGLGPRSAVSGRLAEKKETSMSLRSHIDATHRPHSIVRRGAAPGLKANSSTHVSLLWTCPRERIIDIFGCSNE